MDDAYLRLKDEKIKLERMLVKTQEQLKKTETERDEARGSYKIVQEMNTSLIDRQANLNTRINFLLDLLDPIQRAWRDQGTHSGYHTQMQSRLRKSWPVLTKALDVLPTKPIKRSHVERIIAQLHGWDD